jgi:hypothetical protein
MLARFLLPVVLVTAFLSVATATPVHAGAFKTGNDLLEVCGPSAPLYEQGACVAYVTGVADVMGTAPDSGETVAGKRACFTAQITMGQTRDVAVNYLTRHPELRHYAAAPLVAWALAEAFPCPAVTSRQ